MRRLALVLAIGWAVMVPPFACAATYQDGRELLTACIARSGPGAVFCLGFLEAIAGAMHARDVDEYSACIPDDVRGRDLVDAFVLSWAPVHGIEQYDAASLVAHAFSLTWPCKRPNT